MLSTASACIRYAKIILILTVAALATIVVFGNVTDYGSNFQFVTHVMSMDTTFEWSHIRYRAITSPILHHAFYIFLIACEAVIAILCYKGAYDMWKQRNADAATFHNSKKFSIIALVACCLIWFFAFQVVAAEWFGMWMSKQWNGLPDATRLVTYMFLCLIFITLKNDD